MWSRMVDMAPRILEKLQKHGFSALRCVADGETAVSVYLISSEQYIREAALSAARYYPSAQRLEVLGVRSSPEGAVTKLVVVFVAQPMPSSSDCQQEGVRV